MPLLKSEFHIKKILCQEHTLNRMTTYVITLLCLDVTSLTTSVSTMPFLLEISFIFKVINSNF